MVLNLSPEPLRRKAPPFQEVELRRLIAMYSANYSRYHAKLPPGTKWALSDKSRLLEKWSHYLTGMGIARRTKAQIEEKLRNEVKKIHRYMKAEPVLNIHSGWILVFVFPRKLVNKTVVEVNTNQYQSQNICFYWNKKLKNAIDVLYNAFKNGTGRCDRYRLPSYLDPLVRIMTKNLSAEGTAEKEETSNGMQDTIKEELNSSDEEYSNGQLFEGERNLTLDEIPTQLFGDWDSTQKGKHRDAHLDHSPELAGTSAEAKTNSSSTTLAREVLTCFSDNLSQLLDEEANLMRIRQEEALMAVEVRKLEIEKLNLEIEWLRRRADSERNKCGSSNVQ